MKLFMRVFLLDAGYYLLFVFTACCDCPDVSTPYFDYRKVSIHNNDHVGKDESLDVEIIQGATFMLANSYFAGIGSAAYACSCSENGEVEKYPISEIRIIPDSVFDASIPQEGSISGLFDIFVKYNYEQGKENVYMPLNEGSDYLYFDRYRQPIRLRTAARPVDPNRAYRFQIEVVRSNGTKVSGQTSEVTWGS